MSEPIREQLAKVILGYRPEELAGAQPRDWSAWESSLLASDRILRSFVLSPVGETEAAKPPLDPKPMIALGDWDRHGLGPNCEGYECRFTPRREYSQDREDYR